MTARRLLLAGCLLSAIALAAIGLAPADALRAWLAAAFLWSGVPIGSIGLMMMVRLIGGRWGHATYPWLEAGALTLPIAALAFVPVLVGMAAIYPWVGNDAGGFRGAWLSPLPFALRTLLLFAGLGVALWLLVARRGSAMAVSSLGLIFLAPMMSVVAVDWLVSLDPLFHSSGFGLYAMSIQFTFAWSAAVWLLLGRQPEATRALAAILVTLLLTWMYLAFTHYIIIWSGNLAELVGWYAVRSAGGWGAAYALVALVELGAFLALLLPRIRHSARALRRLAAVLVASKAIEAAWLVLPQTGAMRAIPLLLYLLAAIGLGLVTVAAQSLLLDRRIAARAPA